MAGEDWRSRFAVFAANTSALVAYRPDRFVVPTLLIESSSSPPERDAWATLVGGSLDAIRLEADHYGVLAGEPFEEVALWVRASIDGLSSG